MGQQQIVGPFRALDTVNLIDQCFSNVASWSSGATLIDAVPVQPVLGQVWSIVAWSITFTGNLTVIDSTQPLFGNLGSLVGGVGVGLQPTNGVGIAYVNPMQGFPASPVNIATMWDGNTDPPFPTVSAIPPLGNRTGPSPYTTQTFSSEIPNPLDLSAGDQLSIGLWLTSSLIRNIEIVVSNASWSVIYDDGQQVTTGWGGS
jgi:hypothetical protein